MSEIHRRKTPHQHHHHQHYGHDQQPHQYFVQSDGDHHNNVNGWFDSPLPSPKPNTDILTVLTEDNQRLRKKNFMLLSELAHMKNLYNDIIYFIQNHVKPVVPFEQRSCSTDNLIELDSSRQGQSSVNVGVQGAKSCSLSIGKSSLVSSAEEKNSTSFKLFGVPLSGKKRLFSEKVPDF